LILIFYPQVPRKEWALRLAMGLQLGGALGNFADRIKFGHVTDFISVWNFPVFNVADSSITIGVAVLIIAVYIEERRLKKAQALEVAEVLEEEEEVAVD
jgi:signal peptidase II